MNRNLLIFIILVIIGGLTVYTLYKKPTQETNKENLFKLLDTASVVKIIINTPNYIGLSLYQTDTGWVMNTRVKADPIIVNQLLNTAHRVQVVYPVDKTVNDKISEEVLKIGSSVTFYNKKDQIMKTYVVGNATLNNKGTYFYNIDEKRSYVCAIPGFEGFLNHRYLIDEREWRDRTIFRTELSNIKKVKISYLENPESDFEIEVFNHDSFTIRQPNHINEMPLHLWNRQRTLQYLTFYKSVYCEGYDNNNPRRDSIMSAIPYCIVRLDDFDNNFTEVKVFHRLVNKRSKSLEDKLGNIRKYDVDRYWASINHNNDLVVIQHFSFGKLFRRYEEFFDN